MGQVTITLPDGSTRDVSAGTPVRDVAAGISPGLAKAAYAAVVDGKLVDLSYPIEKDAAVRIVTDRSPEALPLLRHSTAHLMAAAVMQLFPGAQLGIGPATDEGFFYDFIVDRPFVPEDLEAIENKMKELAQQDLPYERQMWPREEAKTFFAARGEPLKVQLIDEKTHGQKDVSCYTIKDKETFVDFCVGPHVPSTNKLKAFKLLSTSNAYWKGDARNAPMQRIYGTAFASDKDLKAYLTQIEEAKKRDHRKLGRELGLFTFHQWAPGAAFWLDKGTTLYNTLANYMREVLFPAGYVEVKTPLVQRVYGDFGLPFTAKLSTRPPEFMGEIATWDHAEAQLKDALTRAGLEYTLNEGDGAFYGPKIDFDVTDAIGRKWQCATIQLDYQQPENFDLTYIGADNAEHRPVVIHRAIFGSFERFIAILIEHYAGAFPLWLAPVQARVLPISDRHLAYARQVQGQLKAADLRVELDERQEKIGYKIREAQLQKVPYMLVVGDRESSEGTISVRARTAGDQGDSSIGDFIAKATEEIAKKNL